MLRGIRDYQFHEANREAWKHRSGQFFLVGIQIRLCMKLALALARLPLLLLPIPISFTFFNVFSHHNKIIPIIPVFFLQPVYFGEKH